MKSGVTLAVLQAEFGENIHSNIKTVIELTRQAAASGANIILPPELFQWRYFCKTRDQRHFAMAYPVQDHPCVLALQPLSKDLGIIIAVSIFERDDLAYYNSVVVINTGDVLGVYRKSHIPDGSGYWEKFYFNPGDTGFKVWDTQFGKVGVGICWDQWFPEVSRSMTLKGADFLLYPSAIGSEPDKPGFDTLMLWQRAMQGQAVCNVVPIAAANRVGNEDGQVFYGGSFITDETGHIISVLNREETGFVTAEFDINRIRRHRAWWGFAKDRREDLYP